MLKSGANLLLLDEPTNDLDVETLRALEEGLENFAVVRSLSATTVGFLTASPRIFWLLKAIAMLSGLRAITPIMRKIASAVLGPMPKFPSV